MVQAARICVCPLELGASTDSQLTPSGSPIWLLKIAPFNALVSVFMA